MPASIALLVAVLESLDWLAVSRRHIAVGEVERAIDQMVEIRVTRMLKGEPPAWIRLRAKSPVRAELLLFFDGDKNVERFVDLGHPTGLLRPDGSEYDRRNDILAAIERRVATDGPPARKLLLHGDDRVIAVPADAEYLPRLVADSRATDAAVRARAAWRLGLYPGPDTQKRLRALLTDKDPTVRQAAWWGLHALGVNLPRPAGWTDSLVESMLW